MSVELNYNVSDTGSELQEVYPARFASRPACVTVVGTLLVTGAGLAIFSIFMAMNVPIMRYGIEQSYRSFGSYVFFALIGAGLVLPAGVGMLTRRTWGRLMYLAAGPVYLATFVAINGLHQNMALPILTYVIFAMVLNCKEAVDYFSVWVPDWRRE